MELREFVGEVLLSILGGVHDARTSLQTNKLDGFISPAIVGDYSNYNTQIAKGGLPIYEVSFDIAIVVEEAAASKTGIGIVIASVGLGGQAEIKGGHTNTSRISFKVPIAFQVSDSFRK